MDEILLYVPQYETIKIYSQFMNKTKFENSNYTDLKNLSHFNYIDSPITNRLLVNISEYKNEDYYLLIIITSNDKDNSSFNFIVSQFYQSINNDIIYPYNIFMVKNESRFNIGYNNNCLNRLHLISGSGKILLDNNSNENNEYLLDYESQEIMHLANPNNYLSVNNTSDDFIFYSEVMKNEKEYNLIVQKANYIKSFNSKYLLILEYKKEKDLYINYYFSYSTYTND